MRPNKCIFAQQERGHLPTSRHRKCPIRHFLRRAAIVLNHIISGKHKNTHFCLVYVAPPPPAAEWGHSEPLAGEKSVLFGYRRRRFFNSKLYFSAGDV
jgi:hypothetical protein